MADKVIRDAVHGDMVFSGPELEIIDAREMQRLRGIKQLGTAYLVYPSAMHSRFEHSLGTAHLAGRILDALAGQGPPIPEEERLIVRLAALLHDITHIPFGHTFEDERRIFPRHDRPERFRLFLGEGDVGHRLRRSGFYQPVLDVLTGEPPRPYMKSVVRGTVCADLLDYLARDAYFCGFKSCYDERVFRYFELDERGDLRLRIAKSGLVRNDVVSEILSLLRLRYMLSERVYYHHAKVASGAVVSRALEAAVGDGLTKEDLFPLKDEGLLQLLRLRYSSNPLLARLLDRFEARSLYLRAYVLTRAVGEPAQRELIVRYHLDAARREAAEQKLEKRCGLTSGDIIIYCPQAGMALKEADIPVEVGPGEHHLLSQLDLPELPSLLANHRNLWRFYVFLERGRAGRLESVRQAAEELFGHRNELRRVVQGQLKLPFDGS